jgi:hypothetical protein
MLSAAPTMKLDGKKIAILLGCMVAGVVFWDFKFLLPLKLLVVAMHETGHAVASLVAGGRVSHVMISLDQSGECLSAIPDGFFGRVLVSSAGYVGSALAGALLLVLTFRFQARRAVWIGLSVWLTLIGLLYARDLFSIAFCAAFAVGFGAGARWLKPAMHEAVNLFLAAFSILYVVMDLKDDLWNSAVRAQSDAGILASETLIPAIVWAFLWTALSLAIVGGAAFWSVRGRRGPATGTKPALGVSVGV